MAVKTRVTPDGLLEGYDEATGEVVWRQPEKSDKLGRPIGKRRKASAVPVHKVIDGDGKKVWAYKNVNPDHIPLKKIWHYSQVYRDQICARLMENKTITSICLEEGFPPLSVICRWMVDHPEFKLAMKEAREMRAYVQADKVIDLAEETGDKDEAIVNRLKIEAYKWAAEKNNPDEYGVRVKHQGDAQNPIAWVISTGVPQAPAIEVKSEPVSPESEDTHE